MKFPWSKRNGLSVEVAEEVSENGSFISCKVSMISETGPTRDSNEDAVITIYPNDNYRTVFAMVADGMGGHNAGEVASQLACHVAKNIVRANEADLSGALLKKLAKAANEEIYSTSRTHPEYEGMGTTAVMLLIDQGIMFHAHVGDSRLYRLRQRKLTQLTKDHTLVNQMIENGEISAKEAGSHSMKNVITRALGTTEDVEPEVAMAGMQVLSGDRFLLCSDGLYEVLTNEEIQHLMELQDTDLVISCFKGLCTIRGATDNYSAIIVDILHDDFSPDSSITKEQNVLL